jgi:orotate phosphoribosyltransferase
VPPLGRQGPPLTLEDLLPSRRGHFRLESGHHGDLWLDLELLFYRPARIRPLAEELARALAGDGVEVICGPLVEGAFVASLVAEALDVPFAYTDRIRTDRTGLFPVDYLLPPALSPRLRGQRVAVVNDVTSAGSAVGGTLRALDAAEAVPVALATLVALGEHPARLAATAALPLHTLATFPNTLWTPSECPLCAGQVPLSEAG